MFYDNVKSNLPIYKDFLTVSTSVSPVVIEYSKELVLGAIRGNTLIRNNYKVVNRGKYNIKFQYVTSYLSDQLRHFHFSFSEIEENEDCDFGTNEPVRKMFTVTPTEGVLVPNLDPKITINFICKKPMGFRKVPIFKCTFSYPEYSAVLDSFLVTASAKVYFPKY